MSSLIDTYHLVGVIIKLSLKQKQNRQTTKQGVVRFCKGDPLLRHTDLFK